jgi:hypothetical protein
MNNTAIPPGIGMSPATAMTTALPAPCADTQTRG